MGLIIPRRSDGEGDPRFVLPHRTKRAVRGALSLTAVVALVTLSPGPALAQPPDDNKPETASQALRQFQQLSKRLGMLNEEWLTARDKLVRKKQQEAKAEADLREAEKLREEALADEEEFRDEVDDLASASFQGARFNKLSALLMGDSAQDFLDRASALHVLASDRKRALDKYSAAVAQAAEAERKAGEAENSAAEARATQQKLVQRIKDKRVELKRERDKVAAAYHRLSAQEQDELGSDDFVYVPMPGLPNKAVETALAQVGDSYDLGAEGPDLFDCSGLMLYAYAAEGISLPRTSASQYGVGDPVATSALQPGDLLFYGNPIHHVAMYVGGGKLVHASTYGVGVVVADAPYGGGSDYIGAKRIA